MSDEKAKSKSVSLLPSLWDQVEAKAKKSYGGNRSTYIRELVLADLEGRAQPLPAADSPELLLQLYQQYAPALIPELRRALQEQPARDQSRILHYLLDSLLDYLVDHYEGKATRLATLPDITARQIFDQRAAEPAAPYKRLKANLETNDSA